MSSWQRLHLSGTLKAMATSDNKRFFVQLREPPGEDRRPIEFYRWSLSDARNAGDRLVQAYYPHDCEEGSCGTWHKLDLTD